jgi:hypothetical protein
MPSRSGTRLTLALTNACAQANTTSRSSGRLRCGAIAPLSMGCTTEPGTTRRACPWLCSIDLPGDSACLGRAPLRVREGVAPAAPPAEYEARYCEQAAVA